MNNLNATVGQGASLPADAGALLAAAAETQDEAKTVETEGGRELRPILSKDSLSVTTPGRTEIELQMMDSAHETAMNTAKNMVDSPEERKAKAERQARIVAQEDDQKARLREVNEKSIEAAHLQDEIAEKRETKV